MSDMKILKLFIFTATLAVTTLISVSAAAAPILSEDDDLNESRSQWMAALTDAAQTPLFSSMGLNGGHQHSVVFLGDDNSVQIGYYAKGPWAKSEFLKSWHSGGGNKDFWPPVESTAPLPEPSTLALLALGLLALGLLKREQTPL